MHIYICIYIYIYILWVKCNNLCIVYNIYIKLLFFAFCLLLLFFCLVFLFLFILCVWCFSGLAMDDTADPSAELINELRALVASGGVVVPFDERKVRAVVDNMSDSFRRLGSILNNPYADPSQPFYASSVKYYRAKCLRDKRCLLAYLLWRQSQMTNAWWEAKDNTLHDFLSPCESAFLQEYNDIMVDYMTAFAFPLDLRAFTWRPPSTQQLEVRCLVNHVFVSPITGAVINLYKGKQALLGFEEAESLIQQGVVELVD